MSKNIECTTENSPLPSKEMPDCWNEDNRMNALFSPFRSKSANSQDWTSKYKFWHKIIHKWLRNSMKCSFSIPELNETFKRKGCTPLCLITVVEELLRNNEIMLETEFSKEPNMSWLGWSIDVFVKKPITWSFFKAKEYMIGQNIDIHSKYIHLEIVKELANVIISTVNDDNNNKLTSLSEILLNCKTILNNPHITKHDIQIALLWLRHHKKATFKNNSTGDELLVKLSTGIVQEVSETEEGLYKLLKEEDKLEKEIELMEENKIKLISKAQLYLKKNLREVAKTHLRKKTELEKTIEKRANALTNLRVLISNIQNAHSNSNVLTAYETGSNVLKKMEKSGMTEDNVRNVMDDMIEVLEEQKEVNSILAESVSINDIESDSDLERELAELITCNDTMDTKVSDTESELKDLEQRLRNLNTKDIPSLDGQPIKSPITSTNKKKNIVQSECT